MNGKREQRKQEGSRMRGNPGELENEGKPAEGKPRGIKETE
jgi:hypothetical protein